MINFEKFAEMVEEERKLLPDYVFDELNGGVIVDENAKPHPNRMADDLYILGTYSAARTMGKQIILYYGSFEKVLGNSSEEAVRRQIRETLRHEFRHHMETQAGFFGRGTLIEEDKKNMDEYYKKHRNN